MTRPLHFCPLEQTAFQRMEYAAYLKGLLRPFKGKGELEVWADQCGTLRDALVTLTERSILPQARRPPFSLLSICLAQQTTGAGTAFLRWRNLDRSRMGLALWQAAITHPLTPANLVDDLFAMEVQRVVLNMQISLTHTIARQALDCAAKLAEAEAVYLQRAPSRAAPIATQEST
jgi:hypothetical protein